MSPDINQCACGEAFESKAALDEHIHSYPIAAGIDAWVAAAPICAPGEAARSTGTFRHPEKFQHWDEATRAALLAVPEPSSGPVVAVLIGRYNSAVVGPFATASEAWQWWAPSWNRLREGMQIVLRPAPKLRCPSFRPCGERECPVCGTEAVSA